jgi:hypothetical protein
MHHEQVAMFCLIIPGEKNGELRFLAQEGDKLGIYMIEVPWEQGSYVLTCELVYPAKGEPQDEREIVATVDVALVSKAGKDTESCLASLCISWSSFQ